MSNKKVIKKDGEGYYVYYYYDKDHIPCDEKDAAYLDYYHYDSNDVLIERNSLVLLEENGLYG